MLFKRFFLVFVSVCFLASWVFPWIVSAATELHVAAQQGNVGKVKRLLKQEIDVNSLSSSGYTPLHISAGFDKRRVTKLLLINGAKINARDSSGQTPLHLSARRGHLSMVKFLLSQGANPSIRDRSNRTPADIARQYNVNDKVVDLLESKSKKKRAKKGNFLTSIHESGIVYVIAGSVVAFLLVLEFVPNVSF